MRLQPKVLIVLASIWAVICMAIYFDSKYTLIANFQQLEQKLGAKDIQRVHNAIDNKISSLVLYTNSWAEWDDAYDFMKNKNTRFVNSNFVPGTFTSSSINFFLFFDTAGKLYDGKAYDLQKNEFMPIPAGLSAYLDANKSFVTHTDTKSRHAGILNIPEGLVVMTSLPVLTSDGAGPIRGSLLMGYFLNSSFIEKLAETVALKINLFTLPLPQSDAVLTTAWSKLLEGNSYYLSTAQSNMAHGFTLLEDISKNPAGLLRVEMPRDFFNEGMTTTYHYLSMMVLIGLGLLLTMLYLLKVLVLNRILSVSRQVVDINTKAKFDKRIKISGSDEMNDMVSSINSMLEFIELTQEQLKYRITRRTKDLERISRVNRNLFNEMSKQRSVEAKLREDEKILRKMAYYDTLTGLPNRAFFRELLIKAMTHAQNTNTRIAVLFIDVDEFKKINDTYGHDFGDKFLIEISQKLKKSMKDVDVVARLSGDEFMVFITNVTSKEMVDDTVIKIYDSLGEFIHLQNITVYPTFSIGVSIFPDDAETAEVLFNQADLAMYYAKKRAGNVYFYYDAVDVTRPKPTTPA